jgi:hypothetical protein
MTLTGWRVGTLRSSGCFAVPDSQTRFKIAGHAVLWVHSTPVLSTVAFVL